jgi:DNA-binding MarR family transcriptional regulator
MYDFRFEDEALTTWTTLRQTWIAVNKVAELKLAKVKLTPEKAAVLWACRDYPGTLIPAEIARLMFRENQTIAGLLNRMEKEGLVRRVPKRKGHPFTEVKITDKGRKVCDPGVEILKTTITKSMACLSHEQQEQLRKILGVLREKMLQDMHVEPRKPAGYGPGEPISVKW